MLIWLKQQQQAVLMVKFEQGEICQVTVAMLMIKYTVTLLAQSGKGIIIYYEGSINIEFLVRIRESFNLQQYILGFP